ncbi:energy transducer TonB [Paraburkholderia fungorum]|uniref:energy transducer TonB n=1 Tax=Paraburkholderia fungorum TaxID=134537 RepID=UPI0038B8D873
MNNNNRWLPALVSFVLCSLCLLAACTTTRSESENGPPLPSAADVSSRCLARAAASGEPTPTPDQLTALQWRRYVGCALASNLLVESGSVADNPEAIISIRLNADGSVDSIAPLRSSGNQAWDTAVQRAIAAVSPLPAAPAQHDLSRIDLHFRPQPRGPGIGGSAGITGLTGESHWSIRHCTTVDGVTACR